jgi:hypothetical protein
LGNTNHQQKLRINNLSGELTKSKNRHDMLELARGELDDKNRASIAKIELLEREKSLLKFENSTLRKGKKDSGYAEDDNESIDSYFSDRTGIKSKHSSLTHTHTHTHTNQRAERERERATIPTLIPLSLTPPNKLITR